MTYPTTSLIELPRAATARYTVWTDTTDFGLLFHRLFVVGAGSIDEWVCVVPGQAPLALFQSRTDLPVGARMLASDRNYSSWVWGGTYWSPMGPTGTTTITADRNLSIVDFGAVILNTDASNRTLTILPGLPATFWCMLAQAGNGKTIMNPSGVSALSLGTTRRTGGPGSFAWLTSVAQDSYSLTGDVIV